MPVDVKHLIKSIYSGLFFILHMYTLVTYLQLTDDMTDQETPMRGTIVLA